MVIHNPKVGSSILPPATNILKHSKAYWHAPNQAQCLAGERWDRNLQSCQPYCRSLSTVNNRNRQ